MEIDVNIKADNLCEALNNLAMAITNVAARELGTVIQEPECPQSCDKCPRKGVAPTENTAPVEEKPAEKPKKRASHKAEPKEDPAPAPEPESPAAPAPEPEAPAAAPAPEAPAAEPEKSEKERRADARKIGAAAVHRGKKDVFQKLLTDYGVVKLSAVPLDKLDAFLADVGKL